MVWIALTLGCGLTAFSPNDTAGEERSPPSTLVPPTTTWPTEEPGKVLINEVMTRNDGTIMSEPGAFPDWVEIFNGTNAPVALADLQLVDDDGAVWSGTSGYLRPGEHLLLWADGGHTEGHLPFTLSGDGTRLRLVVEGSVADLVEIPGTLPDTSYGRYPDGGDSLHTSIWPTPGYTNGSGPGEGDDPTAVLFDPMTLWDVWIDLPPSSEQQLGVDPYTDVEGSFAFLGAWYPTVGVRLKGQLGSYRTLDAKAGFKVDLNEYAPHGLRGLNSLTFNSMVQDPTYIHEVLAYELYRAAGIPAPRTGYARVTVNDTYYGLYLWIESIDDEFLERWYADPTGHLFEGSYGTDFWLGSESAFEYDEGPDASDLADLTELASFLDTSPADSGAYTTLVTLFDMEAFLMMMAIEALILHWDGYTTANNYRVYHDPITDQFTMLPWGTDQTFVDYVYEPYDGGGRLFTWCLDNAECRAVYDGKLAEAADLMDSLPLEELLGDLLPHLEPEIAADPRRESDDATMEADLEITLETLATSPQRIRDAIGE